MISNSVSKNIMYFTYEFSFITFLMYFIMENPDVKLIKELRYSRILSNKLKTDTDNILNNMKLELNESLSDYIDFNYEWKDFEILNESNGRPTVKLNFEISGLICFISCSPQQSKYIHL